MVIRSANITNEGNRRFIEMSNKQIESMTARGLVAEAGIMQAHIEFAEDDGIVMMTSDMRMYNACGTLYTNGLIGTASHV